MSEGNDKRKYPGGILIGNLPKFNKVNTDFVEESNAMTEAKTQHTPLPWHQGGIAKEEMMSPNTIFGEDGAAIAQFYGVSLHRTLDELDKTHCAEGLANIGIALRAVNSHESLVKALEAARDINPSELSRRIHAIHARKNLPEPTPDEAIVFTLCHIQEIAEAALTAAGKVPK